MHKMYLEDVFPSEYSELMQKYICRLQKILEQYDIVIFMARKAICFYNALVNTGKLKKPASCCVMSSRVLTYNIFSIFREKKIALIDDVVVKGTSIKKSLKILDSNDIAVDIYIVACDEKFVESNYLKLKKDLKAPYIVLSEFDICKLSKYIIRYIEASMCPYNIDQPLYKLSFNSEEDSEVFINQNKFTDITSAIQKKQGIINYVIHFESDFWIKFLNIDMQASEVSIKIRFIKNNTQNSWLVLPFILLPELTYGKIDELFEKIAYDEIIQLIINEDKQEEYENKLKVIQYIYSNILLHKFFENVPLKYELKKVDSNEIIQYSKIILKNKITDDFLSAKYFKNNYQKYVITNGIDYNEYLGLTYAFIERQCIQGGKNSIYTSYNAIMQNLREYYQEKLDIYAVSNLIDILIDRGVLVPSIKHLSEDRILRAYKFGEIIRLSHIQILYFVSMLNAYAENKKNLLGRTELEKLCVLFFRTGEMKNIFPKASCEDGVGDDYYEIAYTKYGPRVAKIEDAQYRALERQKIEVAETLTLARYLEDLQYIKPIKSKSDNYNVLPINAEPDNKRVVRFINAFAYEADLLRKTFPSIEEQEEIIRVAVTKGRYIDVFSYVSTYTKFLTLLSIGENSGERLLSLMAEINLVAKVNTSSTEKKDLLNSLSTVMDGVASGIWKYHCYCRNDLIEDILGILSYRNPAVSVTSFMLDCSIVDDKNNQIIIFLKECGEFLYKVAFTYWVLTSKNVLSSFEFSNKDMLGLRSAIQQKYTPDYLKQNKKIEQDIIELIQEAKGRINICDIYLKERAFYYEHHQKMIVVYTSERNECINNMLGFDFVSGQITRKYSFSIEAFKEAVSLEEQLDELISKIGGLSNVKILICSMENWYEGICNSSRIAKGDYFEQILKRFFAIEDRRPKNQSLEISFCHPTTESSMEFFFISRDKYKLSYSGMYPINEKYEVIRYNMHITKEKKKMEINMKDCKIDKAIMAENISGEIHMEDIENIEKFDYKQLANELELLKNQIDAVEVIEVINEAKAAAVVSDKNLVLEKIKNVLMFGGEVVKKSINELTVPVIKALLTSQGLDI